MIIDQINMNNFQRLDTKVQDNNTSLRSEISITFSKHRENLDTLQGEVFKSINTVNSKIKEINDLLKLREWVIQSIKESEDNMKIRIEDAIKVKEVNILMFYYV